MTHKKKKITKKNHQKKSKKKLVKNRIFFISISLMLLFCGFGYYGYLIKTKKEKQDKKVELLEQESTRELMSKMKKMLDEESKRVKGIKKKAPLVKIPTVDKSEKKTKEKEKNASKQDYLSEIHDYEKSFKETNGSKVKTSKKVTKKTTLYKGKPRLAIIIDDVSFLYQVKQIQKIPFKITPSFFPPSKIHPDTIKFSQKFKFSMVHLPLEAMGHVRPEPKTLLAKSSEQEIDSRIDELKKEFPQIHYYNNHTGSKFTSNTRAMRYLISYMKTENLHFVDSRTTAATKAGEVSRALHVKLLSRDVFLDNVAKPKKIIEQLKKAVKLAKKNGYAIAIGHPHKNTLKTLINAKQYLGDVEMVYVDEL